MSVKKNPKTKKLPFKDGDHFMKIGDPDRASRLSRTRLFKYSSTEDSEVHLLKESKGGGFESQSFSVDQTTLLSEYKVQTENLIKSKLSLDLSPLLGRRVRLIKRDGCHASGELIALSVKEIKIGELRAVVPVLFHVSGVGEIPVAEVEELEVER